jgi:hypothetical protein
VGAIVGAIVGFIGSFFITYLSLYVNNEIDSSKYIEVAYYQISSAKDLIERTPIKYDEMPNNKLLFEGVDWNRVLFEIQSQRGSMVYLKLCHLDDLREKIYQVPDPKNRKKLLSIYWVQFEELKNSNDVSFLTNVLFEHKFSEKKSLENHKLQQKTKDFYTP